MRARAGKVKQRVLAGSALLCAWLGASTAPAAEAAIRPIAGGVTFRTDDNGFHPEYFLKRAEVFDKHGLKFGAAVNLLNAESQPGMVENFRVIQKAGHDLMDHTPNHDNITMRFVRGEDVAWIQGKPGVDHMDKQVACLRYEVTVPADRETRRVNVTGNSFTPVVADGSELWFKHQEFVYFPETKQAFRYKAKTGGYELKSPWGEDDVDLKNLTDVPVQLLDDHEVMPTPEAIGLLAETIRRVCDRNGLKYPVTYCAPGNSPRLTRGAVKAVYGDKFGYRSGCVYPAAAAKVFNEPDPNGDAPFGMQWGQVYDEIPGSELPTLKKRIADLLAVNTIVIIGSHVVQKPEAWTAYFEKIDALLAWLKAKTIPVKTHADWADVLYRSGTRLTGNVFPSLDRDLDEDGFPDGYELVNATPGAASAAAALPEKNVLTATKPGTLFRVKALGGLPHGNATLACWINGPVGTNVNVMVFGVGPASFVLKEGWNRYTAPLTVPDDVATARVDFTWQSKQEGTVSVCGIALAGEPNQKP